MTRDHIAAEIPSYGFTHANRTRLEYTVIHVLVHAARLGQNTNAMRLKGLRPLPSCSQSLLCIAWSIVWLLVTVALHTLALVEVLWQSYTSIILVRFLPTKRGYCGCRRHPVIPQSLTILEFSR